MSVVMAMGMEQVCRWPMASHLLEGMWEVGHGLWLSLPEDWKSIVMAMEMEKVCLWPMAFPLLEGIWEVGHALFPSLHEQG